MHQSRGWFCRHQGGDGDQGLAATEFAVILPLTMALIIFVLALSASAIDRLFAAGLVPQDARAQAVQGASSNLLGGMIGVNTPSITSSAACQRISTTRLSANLTRDWPVIQWLGIVLSGPFNARLNASTTVYNWNFHPGHEGPCQ